MIYDQAHIEAAEARLREAQQEVDRLRAVLTAEHTAAQTGPRLATAADGIAAAGRRHPGRTRSEIAAGTSTGTSAASDADATDITSVEGARAEARRRAALRRPAGGAA